MEIVIGFDAPVAEWVRQHLPPPTPQSFGQYRALGVANGGHLVAGVVFHAYSKVPGGGNIEITLAATSPVWLRPRILRGLLDYPFNQLGCHRMTAIVAKKNKRSRRFTEHFGFRLEGCVRKAFGADDALVFGMLRNECRWLRD